MQRYGNQVVLRGALLFGNDVYVDKNGENCAFTIQINGLRKDLKLLGRAKKDMDIDLRPVISEFNTVEDL